MSMATKTTKKPSTKKVDETKGLTVTKVSKEVSVKKSTKSTPAKIQPDPTAKAREKVAEVKKKSNNPDPVINMGGKKAEVKAEAKVPVKKAPAAKKPAVKKEAAPKTAAPKAVVKKTDDNANKKVLFVGSEVAPFAGTGGLGEVLGSLPKHLNALNAGYSAAVILPLYESVDQTVRNKMKFMFYTNVPLAWRNQYCGLFKYEEGGVTYYFIDNEYYFKRPNIYGYYDDGERFAFFCRAVCEILPKLDFKPDILHCHDWQAALVPIYYKLFYMYREGYENIKTVFTIHNIEYQGKYAKNILEDVFGIPNSEYLSLEHDGCINLVKAALDYSDALNTVSPTYAVELQDAFFAHGLEDVMKKNSGKLKGILNGIDVDVYNPKTNKAIFENFDAVHLTKKATNKTELQKMLSLPVDEKVPMIAIISRLVSHKGLDLVRFAMEEILKLNIQLVILGKGDSAFEDYFTHLGQTYSEKVGTVIAFNRDLSYKVYAAADMFLMPSKSEPCGLSQMMASRFGTVSIVRNTGGLSDSIKDCGKGDTGIGFVFNNYDAAEMLHAINRAVGLYYDYNDKFVALQKRAMQTDFSWSNSAQEYIKFYNSLI